jgi:predicted RNA-binding Zn-ribbon protein involved in translation (DUF1610 family)
MTNNKNSKAANDNPVALQERNWSIVRKWLEWRSTFVLVRQCDDGRLRRFGSSRNGAAMERKWYYQMMGEIVGPLSSNELRQHAVDGQIERDTPIRRGSDGKWILADKVRGLLDVRQDDENTPKTKQTGKRIPPCPVSVAVPPVTMSKRDGLPAPSRQTEETDKSDKVGRELAYLRSLKDSAENARERAERAKQTESARQLATREVNTKVIACKACGNEVSKTAQSCPHCGESAPGLHIECLKCHSINVAMDARGFSLVSAAVGALLIGPYGLLGGLVGSKKVEVVCRACGNRWIPTADEWRRLGSS